MVTTPHQQTVAHINAARNTTPTPVPPPTTQPNPNKMGPPLDSGGVPIKVTIA
jgi:hypothetical protein